MLPEPLRLLISAYATGELTPRRRAAAARLLRHSAEARRLLKDLKANRLRMRALDPPQLPGDFTARIVAALPECRPIIHPAAIARTSPKRFSNNARWAVAAGLLVAFGFGTFAIVSRPEVTPSQADRRRAPRLKLEPSTLPPKPSDAIDDTVPPEATERVLPDQAIAQKPTAPVRPQRAAPTVRTADPLGTSASPLPPLVRVAPPHLVTFSFREADPAEVQRKTQNELAQPNTHRIDLFCRDTAKGWERLHAALKARGVRLFVDPIVQDAVKRKVRGQYLIYCEDLTAAEWSQFLQGFVAAERRSADNPLDSGVVLPFDASDQKELTAIVGVDLTQTDSKARNGAGGTGRPTGTAARPAAGPPTALALFGVRAPAMSKDVRQFLDARRERNPATAAVLLIVRITGA